MLKHRKITRQRCPLSAHFFKHHAGSSMQCNKKEIKDIQIGNEEIKLSLFTDDMIVCVENPKESITENF